MALPRDRTRLGASIPSWLVRSTCSETERNGCCCRHVPLPLRCWRPCSRLPLRWAPGGWPRRVPTRSRRGCARCQRPATPLPPSSAEIERPAQENVVDIIIKGNRAISRDKVLANIGTRIGQPFDQAAFERDIRKLTAKNWFVHVHPLPRSTWPAASIITLEVVERPGRRVVTSSWATRRSRNASWPRRSASSRATRSTSSPCRTGNASSRSFYQSKAFNDVKISILEGNKPGDRRVVYLVHEGGGAKVQRRSSSSAIRPASRPTAG